MVHAQGAFHKLLHAALNVLATPPALGDILTDLRKKKSFFFFFGCVGVWQTQSARITIF